MVSCLEQDADLHMAELMPLPLNVSCFSKIQIGVTFLVLAHPGSPGKGPLNGRVCVCACAYSNSSERPHRRRHKDRLIAFDRWRQCALPSKT